MSDALEAALAYASRGYHVLPLQSSANGSCSCDKAGCDSRGKHPRTEHGLLDATTDAATICAWWTRWPDANIGVSMGGSGLAGVDVDVHDGKPGMDTWQDLKGKYGAGIENTAVVETPTGGMHLWYVAAPYRISSREGALGEGVDVKAEGGYLVAPPSSIGGVEYAWAQGHELDRLATIPEALGKDLSFAKQKTPKQDAKPGGERIPKGQRHAALVSLGGTMRNKGSGEKEIAAALHLAAAARCDPPYTDTADVDAIARDAAKWQIGKAAAPEPPKPRKHVRVYSLPELAALQPEQVEWVLEDYLAAGDVGSLESPPKGGKSTWARKLSKHVATGEPFLGHAVKQGPVLYCTEERAGTSREGFARAGALEVPDLHVMFLHDAHGLEWAEKVEEVGEHCKRLGVVLVSFDTLSKWAGLVGEEEQSSGSAMEVMGPLQHLAAAGLAVFVIRHERKSGGLTGEAGRGSSAFTGDLDVILSLRKVNGEKTRRKLGAVGRHDATPEEVVIDYVDGDYVSLGDPHVLRRQEQERAIVALLPRSRGEQILLDDLCEPGGVSRSKARRLLLELVAEGVAMQEHGGVPGHPRADGYWLRGDDD